MTLLSYTSAVRMALTTIRQHKLRSLLTVLGVIIGTSTIIGVGSIITGLDGAITEILRSFGTNTLIVFKFKVGIRFNVTPEERQRKPLTYQNALAIAERCPAVAHVSPFLFPPSGIHRAKYKGADIYRLDLGGTEQAYAEGGGNAAMLYGRFFTDAESRHRRPVEIGRASWRERV